MMHEGKITVELTPEQMADLIDAATRAAEQDQEDAEILSSQPRIDRETVGELLETRKRLLTLAAWMQHLWEEAVDEQCGTHRKQSRSRLPAGEIVRDVRRDAARCAAHGCCISPSGSISIKSSSQRSTRRS